MEGEKWREKRGESEWESNELGFVTHVLVMLEFQHH